MSIVAPVGIMKNLLNFGAFRGGDPYIMERGRHITQYVIDGGVDFVCVQRSLGFGVANPETTLPKLEKFNRVKMNYFNLYNDFSWWDCITLVLSDL